MGSRKNQSARVAQIDFFFSAAFAGDAGLRKQTLLTIFLKPREMEKPSTRPRHKVARKMKWSWVEWQLWAESMRNENDPRIACILSFYFAFYLMAKTIRRKAGEERGEKMWNTKNRETWGFLLRVSGCTKVGRDCNSICDRSGWSEAASMSIVGDITAQSNLIL